MFALVKAFVPRYRYDQLMRLGWKVFLPTSLAMVALVAAAVQYGIYPLVTHTAAQPPAAVATTSAPNPK
jgi:hypothetical protein